MKIENTNISKVYLRPLRLEDVRQEYVDWLNDPQVNHFLETRNYPQDIASVEAFVCAQVDSPNNHLFAICLKENDQHIGNIKIGAINEIHQIGDVSLFIGNKDFWGQGIAKQAIYLLTGYGFSHLGLRKIIASAYKDNKSSLSAFEHVGYYQEAVRKKHYVIDGKPMDIIFLAIFSSQFKGSVNLTP